MGSLLSYVMGDLGSGDTADRPTQVGRLKIPTVRLTFIFHPRAFEVLMDRIIAHWPCLHPPQARHGRDQPHDDVPCGVSQRERGGREG